MGRWLPVVLCAALPAHGGSLDDGLFMPGGLLPEAPPLPWLASVARPADLVQGLPGGDLRYLVEHASARSAMSTYGPAPSELGGGVRLRGVGLDVMVTRRFLGATPYAGVGAGRVIVGTPGVGIGRETLLETRMFTGVTMNLSSINVALEAEKGINTTVSAKLGWRF